MEPLLLAREISEASKASRAPVLPSGAAYAGE